MGHQDKLKRDRIGIIFKRAKKNAWDARQKRYEERKCGQNLHKPEQHEVLKSKNQRVLYLEQDDIQNFEHNIKKPIDIGGPKTEKATTKKVSTDDPPVDYNFEFENRIDADEREFVNYDHMFQDLPNSDTPSQQEIPGHPTQQ